MRCLCGIVTSTPERFPIARAPVTNADRSSALTRNGTQTASARCSINSRFNNSGDLAVVSGSPTKPYSRVVPLICVAGCTSAGTPRRLAAGKFQLIHRCRDLRTMRAEQGLQLPAQRRARSLHVRQRIAFKQSDPSRDLRRVGARFLLGRFYFADGLVCEAEVCTRDAFVVTEWRQQALPQCHDDVGTVALADVEALCEHESALTDTVPENHAADRARHVAKRRHDAPRPFRRRIQAVQIILPAEHFRAVGLVEIEVLRRARNGNIAAAATESRNADSLWHVLAVVPLMEFVTRLRQQVVPDADCS